jgi:DNA repair exonuclease SbcCD ATPase subunit
MKVTKLRLENFRIHKDSVLSFGGASIVVIRGSNFAGKSTIGQGLSMCLTPSATGLDPQGRGFISKIKRGASKAVITADFQTKRHLVERTVILNSNASGRTQKTVCLSDPDWNAGRFDSELEKQRAALTVVLNTDAFLHMDEKEQKNLLAGLALPSRYDFPAEIITQVEAVLEEETPKFSEEPFTVINKAYRRLFDERQIINRQVKEFFVPEALPSPADVDSDSIQRQLAALRAQRTERMHARDQAVATANREETARVRAKAKVEEVINTGHRCESAIREKLLKEGQLGYLHKIAAGKELLDELKAEHTQAVIMRESCAIQLKGLEGIPWGAKACPWCEQPVDPAKLKAVAQKVSGTLREVNASLNMIEQKIQALGDVDEAVNLLNAHEQALKELSAFDTQAAERQQEIERAQKDVPGPTLFDFAPFNETIAECDMEIERLSGLLRPVIVAEERHKEVEVKRSQLATLKEKATLLDQLVKYFDKDGIKAKLIGQYIGGFEQKLNEVMSAWGYSCALSIDPYAFDVTNARGDVIPVRELSGAERVMFSLAFQCAVSMTAGIGMVVIDEVSTFLPEVRSLLYRKLSEMVKNGFLEQAILLVADIFEQVSDLPGAVFYMVKDGAVYALPQNNFVRKEAANERRDERSIA